MWHELHRDIPFRFLMNCYVSSHLAIHITMAFVVAHPSDLNLLEIDWIEQLWDILIKSVCILSTFLFPCKS